MAAASIRQKLYDYIRVAEDRKESYIHNARRGNKRSI
jgi:hypothetical protein